MKYLASKHQCMKMESREELPLTRICARCQQVLQAADGAIAMDKFENQTFEKFCDAASDGCYFCFTLRSEMIYYKTFETLNETSWGPPTFTTFGKESEGFNFVTLTSPGEGLRQQCFWTLTPLRDHPYGPNLIPRVEKHSLSILSLDLALAWLQRCLSSHERCTTLTRLNQHWLPTRLIDIGIEDGGQWRLIETAKGVAATPLPYMTLSYRWGPHPSIKLTSSSFESFRSKNSVEQLPLAFRDAIYVVRHFGIRYLWIDSLCIIQDSLADWEAEAPKMRYIYSNSTCNLAASASYDPAEGLFRERDPAKIGPHVVETTLTNGSLEKHIIVEAGYWESRIQDGGLHNRGWVFQECLLAPRVLYFTKDQLMWECTETHGCEAFPDGVMFKYRVGFDIEKAFNDNAERFFNFDLGVGYGSGVWMFLVQLYTHCRLTKPDDRLYAIAGVAKLFQEMTGYKYLAGLWQEDLLHQLGWTAFYPAPKTSAVYRAPSWSWASIDGPVQANPHSEVEFFIQIIDVHVTAKGIDSTLDASDGHLTIRCSLVSASYVRKTQHDDLLLRLEGASARTLTIGTVFVEPDIQDEPTLIGTGTIDFFFYDEELTGETVYCMIVERTRGAGGVFKRVGMLRITKDEDVRTVLDMMESGDVKSEIITLV